MGPAESFFQVISFNSFAKTEESLLSVVSQEVSCARLNLMIFEPFFSEDEANI